MFTEPLFGSWHGRIRVLGSTMFPTPGANLSFLCWGGGGDKIPILGYRGGWGVGGMGCFQEQMQRIGPRPGASTRAPLQNPLKSLPLLLPLAGACLHGV